MVLLGGINTRACRLGQGPLPRLRLRYGRAVFLRDKDRVTESFNTTTYMDRLTLNMLLLFAQFEREITAERIRDKIAASKAKGMWMGRHRRSASRPAGGR